MSIHEELGTDGKIAYVSPAKGRPRPLLRDHALKFNENCGSDNQEVADVIQTIFNEIVQLRKVRHQKVVLLEALKEHVSAVVLELYLAYKCPPYVYRAISRRAQDYTRRPTRYKRVFLSFRLTIGVLDDLIELGYLEQHKGFYDRTINRGNSTRIRARRKLVNIVESFGVVREMIWRKGPETILLRDENKQYVEYEDTEITVKMRRNLDHINSALKNRRIGLALSNQELNDLLLRMGRDPKRGPLELNAVELRRVFNNCSFEQGGRFYGGWWQRIPKEVRPYISIDQKNTVEVDYSGLHIRMLYGQAEVECPDDPYDLSEYPREDQKIAVLTVINAKTLKAAIGSLKEKGIGNARLLCEALVDRHRPISNNFYSGKGTYLQFMDSRVAELVMLKIIALGGVALPVHDSFIVRKGREGELEAVMDQAFREIFPKIAPKHKRKIDILELKAKMKTDTEKGGDFVKGLADLSATELERLLNSYK